MKIRRFAAFLLMLASLLILTACGGKSKNNVTASFDSSGGAAVSSQSLSIGALVKDPGEPEISGNFAFKGWYFGDKLWDFSKDTITENITLKAKWIPIYTIHYDSNGGSAVIAGMAEEGTFTTAPTTPNREHHAFKGWYLGDKLWDFSKDAITENITLTAKWIPVHTVKFNSNGGSTVKDAIVETGSFAGEPEAPTKQGYAFKGWFLGENQWNFIGNLVTSDITLTAKWVKLFTVTFDSNGGSSVNAKEVEEGMLLTAPTPPTRENHKFLGWFNGETAWDFENGKITADITLTANWKNTSTYTVTFDSDGGTAVEPQYIPHGENLNKPEDPMQEGLAFKGWYNGDKKWDFENDTVTENITLKAKWEKEGIWLPGHQLSYKISFDTNGGNEIPTQTHASNVTIYSQNRVLPIPERAGYTFGGWFLDGVLFDEKTVKITKDMTLVARWGYTVIFDDGSESPMHIFAEENSFILKPQDPESAGLYFGGWWNGEEKWNFNTDRVTSDMTLTAKWETSPLYTVTFDSNGGTLVSSEIIEIGEKVTCPSSVTLEGHTLLGWWYGDKEWSFDSDIPSGNITLTAKWVNNNTLGGGTPDNETLPEQRNSYTLTFVSEGIILETKNYYANKTISESGETLPTPEKSGYRFAGWFVDGVMIDSSLLVNSDLTVAARWELA